jgi:hypothetical protein
MNHRGRRTPLPLRYCYEAHVGAGCAIRRMLVDACPDLCYMSTRDLSRYFGQALQALIVIPQMFLERCGHT